jgi:hypothetical protein
MSSIKKKSSSLLEKKKDGFIIFLNKDFYSKNKVEQYLKQINGVGFFPTSRKGYFALKAKTSGRKECLELTNYIFSLHC